MLYFIGMALSFAVGSLLAMVIVMSIMLNRKFMKWYMKKVYKLTEYAMQAVLEVDEEEES